MKTYIVKDVVTGESLHESPTVDDALTWAHWAGIEGTVLEFGRFPSDSTEYTFVCLV